MHIVNIMFSAIAGGIEQAFVDYCEGFKARGHTVTAITHPNAAVVPYLRDLNIKPVTLRNLGEWDPLAMLRIRRKLLKLKPDIVISHTHRSTMLTRFAAKGLCPRVGVAHNYNKRVRRLKRSDAVFATTHDLISHLVKLGVPEEKIFHIPNMVRCHELPHHEPRHRVPVIGAMGRFVEKKGFDVFIDALKILKDRGVRFEAVLAGIGDEEAALKKKARLVGLRELLTFPGWVEDKKAFYSKLDIFCLPSLHEPFGIVLLEAFVNGAPVIATDSEGPRDIITPNFDALVVPVGDAKAMADAIDKLIKDAHLADDLAANAFAKAKMHYSIEGVALRIEKALEVIIARWKR